MLYVGIATMIFAMVATWALTPPVIRLARRLGALDRPGGRKTHATPMPRIGGVAVFVGFFLSVIFAGLLTGTLVSIPRVDVYWQGLMLAAGALFVIGLVDDLYSVSYRWKFAVQILAGVFVWQCGFRVELLSNPFTGGAFELGWLSLPVTVLWIVGITNAVNLIDGLDGLAAGVALISTLSVGVIAFYRSELGVTAASVALAGSLIGFLRFNFNPAQIFLGDSGSLFLGFVLAVTSVRGSQKGATAIAILAPLLILGLPLLDTGLAVARRLLRLGIDGRKADKSLQYVVRNLNQVFLPDRGHIHHRLIDFGLGHRTAVLVLYGVTCLFVLSAFALVVLRSLTIGLLLIAVLFLMTLLFGLITYIRYRRGPEAEGTASSSVRKPEINPLARSGHVSSR